MEDSSRDTRLRVAAFERVRALCEIHDHLTAQQLGEGFYVDGQRYPLVNPRRGIFKPAQMRFLLSINTVFPKTGNRVWYDDQRDVHRQIFDGDEMVDYAFMGENPDAADNRWLREAFENQIPTIYFLGIAPGRYQAILPAFIGGWDRVLRRAQITFGLPEEKSLAPPATEIETIHLTVGQATSSSGLVPRSRYRSLPRSVRAVRSSRVHVARRGSHRGKSARIARATFCPQRYPTLKNPPRRVRRSPDRDRPGLPIACFGAFARSKRRPDAGGNQRAGRRGATPPKEDSRSPRSGPSGVAVRTL
jgi:hypothetical protein